MLVDRLVLVALELLLLSKVALDRLQLRVTVRCGTVRGLCARFSAVCALVQLVLSLLFDQVVDVTLLHIV